MGCEHAAEKLETWRWLGFLSTLRFPSFDLRRGRGVGIREQERGQEQQEEGRKLSNVQHPRQKRFTFVGRVVSVFGLQKG